VEAAATVRAYLLGAATNLVSAAVRLVPLGHTQGQQAIACLHAEIEAVLPRCLLATDLTAIASFALLQERDCQRHRHLYTRLFQS
jgi:urease accessory protein